MAGWLKLHRGRTEALALLLQHPYALALLTLLATRARFSEGRDPASGVELHVGEALTGRGDAAAIGATPKQYRVARDQLIKWGFVAMVGATTRAMWGTALKITDSGIYEIVPIDKGQAEGQAKGQAGAKQGPSRGHESRTVEQIDLPPPTPSVPGGVDDEKTQKISQLTDKIVAEAIKKGREIKNIDRYRERVAENLARQSAQELQKSLENQDDGLVVALSEAERTRNYLKALEN
ncbi:hypothetical protein ACUUL3_07195 [Thiovibrio sp. JS02]